MEAQKDGLSAQGQGCSESRNGNLSPGCLMPHLSDPKQCFQMKQTKIKKKAVKLAFANDSVNVSKMYHYANFITIKFDMHERFITLKKFIDFLTLQKFISR